MEKKYIFKEVLASKLKNQSCIDSCHICVDKGRKTSDFAVHTHDFSELVIITSGKATHIIGPEEYTVREGDIFVVNGDILHGYKNVDNLQLYNIPYIPERVFKGSYDLKKLAGFQVLFILEPYYRKEHEFESRLTLPPHKLNYVKELLALMDKEFTDEKEGFIQAVHGFFIALVAFLSRECVSAGGKASEQLIGFAEAVAYMENNFRRNISLKELADMAFYSPRHFARVFKQNYFFTPAEYLLNLRIKQASRLLKDESKSMVQVAEESGFSDSNYFSRVFRKKTGQTPSEFRRNAAGSKQPAPVK